MTDESQLVTIGRTDTTVTPSKRGEIFQEKNSVYMEFGSQRSIRDNLESRLDTLEEVPKEDTLPQQRNNEQSEAIDEEEKFVDDDSSSGEKLVSLRERKRFSVCDSPDTDDPQ